MIKIESYSRLIYQLPISNHFEFMSEVRTRIEQEIQQIPLMDTGWTRFLDAFNHEDDVYKRHRFIYTEELVVLDKQRKGFVSEIFDIVRLRLKKKDEVVAQAAKLLSVEIVHTYKNISRLNYEARTGDITNMIQAFQQPKYQAAVAQLALMPTINELTSSNYNFSVKYKERAEEYRAQKEGGSASDARIDTNKAFHAMVMDLLSISRSNELGAKDQAVDALLGKISFSLNSIIDQTKKVEAHRKGNNEENENGSEKYTD
ncbi:MAG: DUF6261 family protein [Tannerellaceae bacterium]|jgi:hypothetical protein|nr:DUF6261 family protein [Tannerellaceae bacterium]